MINIIFPIAGDGTRFKSADSSGLQRESSNHSAFSTTYVPYVPPLENQIYKPFIKICDITFIEYAVKSFLPYLDNIDTFYFIYREDQEVKFNITATLTRMFSDQINIKCIIISSTPTSGAIETIKQGYSFENKECIICDCDHYVDITPLMELLYYKNTRLNNYKCVMLVWDLKEHDENPKDWGTMYINKHYKKIINEKKESFEDDDLNSRIYGIIGCTYFDNINIILNSKNAEHMTDIIREQFEFENSNNECQFVHIKNAHFFGDPKRKDKFIDITRDEKTVFVDLDGTLIRHEPNPNYDIGEQTVLPETVNILRKLKYEGYYIVITTGRKQRESVIKNMLNRLKIPFDRLVSDLPSGPRILINDLKESRPFYEMAKQINVVRDVGLGLGNIVEKLDTSYEKIKVLKTFKGGSPSKTQLIEKDNNLQVIRKSIFKKDENMVHYNKLRRQYTDMKLFGYLIVDITPEIFEECDTDFAYYYDMQFLQDYTNMSHLNEMQQDKFANKLLRTLKENAYSLKRNNFDNYWIVKYFDRKINLQKYANLHPDLKRLIYLDDVVINGVKYDGITKTLHKIFEPQNNILQSLNPKYLSHIHGDLTFENIMVNESTGDIKLIDMDGSDYIDAVEMDLGKMCQSIVAKYEKWGDSAENLIHVFNENTIKCRRFNYDYDDLKQSLKCVMSSWMQILELDYTEKKTFYNKCCFYLTIHLFRMIPYKCQSKNIDHALFALKEAIIYLNWVLK